jgi:predicted PurR-regulated permease PerM
VFSLLLLIVPAVLLSETLIGGAKHFAADLADGKVSVPPPPDKIADWPIVGAQIFDAWRLASENLAAALGRMRPQLEAVSGWLLRAAGSAGVALLQLAASFVVAGFLLARSEGRHASIERLATRLAGPRGPEFTRLAAATVNSVVQGILGVAVIQTLLAGLGFILVGVPAAGLWALLVLVSAVVQLPVALVMIPPILFVFANASVAVAIAFTLWCLAIALLDNVLKPMLFGRGVEVPTLVIFLGAIGGMLAMGIIGLFLGAVVLALGYELFIAWLGDAELQEE